jgi:hypothetical protein
MLITKQDVGKKVTFRCGDIGHIFAWNHHHTNPVQIRSINDGWDAHYTVDGKCTAGNARDTPTDIIAFVEP